MTADLFFHNVEFYGAPNGQLVRVLVGSSFTFRMNDAPEGYVLGTAKKDAALKLVEGELSQVTAEAVGFSEIQVQVNHSIPFYITVEVYSTEAATLGLSAGSAQPK